MEGVDTAGVDAEAAEMTTLLQGCIPYNPIVVALLQVESEVLTWKKLEATVLSTSHVESER